MSEEKPKEFQVGIWLVFGKDNQGSFFDRQYFQQQMKNPKYRTEFFNLTTGLSKDYWISVGQTNEMLTHFQSEAQLTEAVGQDNDRKYFIVGRTYLPGVKSISENNIEETILKEFKRLYPIYNFMRDKRYD
jgi:hypothetical protein